MIDDEDFDDDQEDDDIVLTDEERRAVDSLKRLARRWPPSLWVFCNGAMVVLKKNADGERAMHPGSRGGSVDQSFAVATINIENDGGDY